MVHLSIITALKRTLRMFAVEMFRPKSHFKLNCPHLAHKHAIPQQLNL